MTPTTPPPLAAPPAPPAVRQSAEIPPFETLADLIDRLGGISPSRIRLRPPPGTAVEADVIEAAAGRRLCELVDGVLVEKVMGYRESVLAAFIIRMLAAFVADRNLGFVSGEGGMMRLFPGLVRIPDVAYASWGRLPDKQMPREPVPGLAPDLIVEVLSQSNTPAEMDRKRREYFDAGVRLAWFVDPEARRVAVYTSAGNFTVRGEAESLDGGDVLAGFTLSLRDLFAELDRHGNP